MNSKRKPNLNLMLQTPINFLLEFNVECNFNSILVGDFLECDENILKEIKPFTFGFTSVPDDTANIELGNVICLGTAFDTIHILMSYKEHLSKYKITHFFYDVCNGMYQKASINEFLITSTRPKLLWYFDYKGSLIEYKR